ncbi:MAG TPA: hypothetical protein VF376_03300, partial [Thermoanaerobaculia bacterium]
MKDDRDGARFRKRFFRERKLKGGQIPEGQRTPARSGWDWRSLFRIHALLACVFTSLACSTGFYHFAKSLAFPPGSVTKTLPSAKVAPRDPPKSFIAGVGIADITPSPGFPTGGHGPAGNLARGHWLRLHA